MILGGFWEAGTCSFALFKISGGNASVERGAGVLPVEELAALECLVKHGCSPTCSFPFEDSSSGSEMGFKSLTWSSEGDDRSPGNTITSRSNANSRRVENGGR